jgi:hypothetical protein
MAQVSKVTPRRRPAPTEQNTLDEQSIPIEELAMYRVFQFFNHCRWLAVSPGLNPTNNPLASTPAPVSTPSPTSAPALALALASTPSTPTLASPAPTPAPAPASAEVAEPSDPTLEVLSDAIPATVTSLKVTNKCTRLVPDGTHIQVPYRPDRNPWVSDLRDE